MKVNIGILSYGDLTKEIIKVAESFKVKVNFFIVETKYESILEDIKAMKEKNDIDVFISAGGYYKILENKKIRPRIKIELSLIDFLFAFQNIFSHSENVAVVTFGHTIPYVKDFKNLIKGNVYERIYKGLPI